MWILIRHPKMMRIHIRNTAQSRNIQEGTVGFYRGIIVHVEYHSACPFVGIGSPYPLPNERVWLEEALACWVSRPNSDEGTETLVLYVL